MTHDLQVDAVNNKQRIRKAHPPRLVTLVRASCVWQGRLHLATNLLKPSICTIRLTSNEIIWGSYREFVEKLSLKHTTGKAGTKHGTGNLDRALLWVPGLDAGDAKRLS